MHIGEGDHHEAGNYGRIWAPASWQDGYEEYKEIKGIESDFIAIVSTLDIFTISGFRSLPILT